MKKKRIENELKKIGEKDRKKNYWKRERKWGAEEKVRIIIKKYGDYKKLREIEKKKYAEQISNNKKKNDEQKKIKDEQNNAQVKIWKKK